MNLSRLALREELPRLLVPQGMISTARPSIEWESALAPSPARPIEAQARLTASPEPEGEILTDVGPFRLAAPRIERCPLAPPPGRPVWLWVRERRAGTGDWSRWNPLQTPLLYRPLPLGPGRLTVYDLSPTRKLSPRRAFEEAHLAAALQGLVNRAAPRLFLTFLDVDSWWLEELRREEGWLAGAEVERPASVEELLALFTDSFRGVVAWDREVDATSNVASTIAGVESLLPIAESADPDSLWRRLVEGGPRLPVLQDLRGKFTGRGATLPDSSTPSTGSAKCDAYLWAKERYLDTGRCNPQFLAYYIDAYWIRRPEVGQDWSNHTLTNHDYYISNRAFFWDLNVWADESPVDDPGQAPGTDYRTLLAILRSARARVDERTILRVGGFTPWAFKYTECEGAGGKRHGVHTEWETVRIISQFDGLLDADALHLAGLANASFYQHYPLPRYLVQGPAPTPGSLRRRGCLREDGRVAPRNYLLHYVGDYDSAAWVISQLPDFWKAPERGKTPLSWAINPNLAERGAPMFDFMYRNRTALDSFQSGDSGAGYVNPTGLLPPREISGLPSGEKRWVRHCQEWFRRMNLTVTGFIINAFSGTMTPEAVRMFEAFSGDGIVLRDTWTDLELSGSMPFMPMRNEGLPRDVAESTRLVLDLCAPENAERPTFITCRSVLYPPRYYLELEGNLKAALGGQIEILDPREFFYLARHWLGGRNRSRVTWLFDTAPSTFRAGRAARFTLALRNDGWDVWRASGPERMAIEVSLTRDGERAQNAAAASRFALPRDVEPGDSVLIETQITPPEGTAPADLWLRAELVQEARGYLDGEGCLPLILPLAQMR